MPSTWRVCALSPHPRVPQKAARGQPGALTLGSSSWPTSSCRCLTVLSDKVLMAKGSHRIMDRSL